MQKRGLKDIKRRNRHVILQTVLDNKKLSRVEIAQKTELAPSTVSALVAEMIEQGYLIESGSQITAGRSRTELTLNPDYGTIAVLEINRKGIELSIYDMALQVIERNCRNSALREMNCLMKSQMRLMSIIKRNGRWQGSDCCSSRI